MRAEAERKERNFCTAHTEGLTLKRPFVKPGYTDDAFAQTASDRLEKNGWILVEHGDEALRTCQRVGLGQKGLQCGNFAKRLKNFGFIQKLFVKDMGMVT